MASFYDPAWMSTSKDTATNIFVGPGVEFGWGKDAGHSVTLDMHDDGRLVLALHCAGSHDECSFEDAHMTVTSTAFTGASLSLTGSTLSGRISMASLHAQDGILEIKLHDLKITTNGQTQTQTCEFVIVQVSSTVCGCAWQHLLLGTQLSARHWLLHGRVSVLNDTTPSTAAMQRRKLQLSPACTGGNH